MLDLTYPFSAIVGQDAMRTALLLLAADPGVGGLLISGHKGTGKSTAVRALAGILPPIEIVEDCPFHCDPRSPDMMEDLCRSRLSKGGPLPTRRIPTPIAELPLHATEDRLIGSLHVERTLRDGERRFEPGLLASAHRGILYVDEVNLLPDHLVDALLDVAASGVNVVERDGVSVRHASRFILVGTMNPEEGELRPQLLDRFGLFVHVRGIDDAATREEIVRRRLAFDADRAAFSTAWRHQEDALAAQVARATSKVHAVRITDDAIRSVVRLCSAAKVQGHRAEIAMIKAARAIAALLDKQEVGTSEVHQAASFVLPHRMTGNPLLTPETIDQQVRQIIAGGSQVDRSADDSPAEDDVDMAESMQVPGSMAAGSILLELEKKSLKIGCSMPMSAPASPTSTSRG